VKILPLTEARKDLSKLIDEVSTIHEHITITRQGKPAAVVMSADEFESWHETLEILDDSEAMAAIRRGLRDVKAGRVRPLEDVLKRLGV